jgi:hypothetical protein
VLNVPELPIAYIKKTEALGAVTPGLPLIKRKKQNYARSAKKGNQSTA